MDKDKRAMIAATAAKKICILGGDMRQVAICDTLTKSGAAVSSWGYPSSEREASWREALTGAAAVVLPLPMATEQMKLNMPLSDCDAPLITEIIEATPKGAIVLAGKVPGIIRKYACEHNVRLIDYFEYEEVQIKNTVPTAEGAIEIAMRSLPGTIMDSKAAVLGYGKVGKTLARTLLALKADVLCAARSERDLAWANVDGCRTLPLSAFCKSPPELDVIFNTIPIRILDRDVLGRMKKNTLIIDLASAPGGVDLDFAKALGIKAMIAPSLPGKAAPYTAGRIIGETLLTILGKEGILL